jgi:hypothetical protein
MRGLVETKGWTEGDLFEFEVVRMQFERAQGLDPESRMEADLVMAERGSADYAGDWGAPNLLAKAWLNCAQADMERGRDPAKALIEAKRSVDEAMKLAGDAPGPQRMFGRLSLLEGQAALLKERSAGTFLDEALVNYGRAEASQPKSPEGIVGKRKTHLMRASWRLLCNLDPSEDLIKAHAAASRLSGKSSSQVLESDLGVREGILSASAVCRNGKNPIPLLEQTQRLVLLQQKAYPRTACLRSMQARIAATLAWIDPRPDRILKARQALASANDLVFVDIRTARLLIEEAEQGHIPTKKRVLKCLSNWSLNKKP